MPHIHPHAWTDGFKDAYAGHAARQVTEIDGFSYASGRVEGEALRLKHRHEYEQTLFEARRIRSAVVDAYLGKDKGV